MTSFSPLASCLPLRSSAVVGGLLALLVGCTGPASAPSEAPRAPEPALSSVATVPPDYDFPARDTVRVATWNVENFVDSYDDPYVDVERENEPGPEVEARIERLAQAIRRMNADVVVLQEFESEAFLQRVVDSHLPESGYRFFASTESPTWFQNVVVMSRYPLGVLHSYADVTTPIAGFTADNGAPEATSLINHRLWLVEVQTRPDDRLHLVGAHLKAGRSPRDRAWRIGQIRFLHTELARLLEDRPSGDVLVAGDLNATANSPELRLLLNTPERPAPDSLRRGTRAWRARFRDPLHGTDTFTFPSEDPDRQLDYLLPNRHLLPELLDGSIRVASPLPPAGMAATSDHLPVIATFLLEDRPAAN